MIRTLNLGARDEMGSDSIFQWKCYSLTEKGKKELVVWKTRVYSKFLKVFHNPLKISLKGNWIVTDGI